tara:strand:- start:574 stop:873 length:300 start_codon:yes stop_codon:yes gene_type:complete
MAINYTWHIPKRFTVGADQRISRINIIIIASDGTKESVADFTITLALPETMIPFADVTQDMVIGWAKNQLGADEISNIENNLKKKIDKQYSATTTAHSW